MTKINYLKPETNVCCSKIRTALLAGSGIGGKVIVPDFPFEVRDRQQYYNDKNFD
jgi:hypothetical protein